MDPEQPTESRPSAPQVTLLLQRLASGDSAAHSELMPLVYSELRAIAGQIFSAHNAGDTLQPTALVHDAYLKLLGREADWNDRQHFFSVASLAMRSILTDHARARGTDKRGGNWRRVTLNGIDNPDSPGEFELVDLDKALTKLSSLSPRQCRIVELRFLTGLPVEEVAKIMDISSTTVGNEWRAARAFLRRELKSQS